jgi:long-chain acyl-CoA synthetase
MSKKRLSLDEALAVLFQPNPSWASREVMTGPDKKKVTFHELESFVQNISLHLTKLGIKAADKVMISALNSPLYVAVILATWRVGAILLPIDCRLTSTELVNIQGKMEAKVFFGAASSCEGMKASNLKPENIIDLSQLASTFQSGTAAGIKDTEHKIVLANLNLQSPALLMLTSGTTGMPKAASHNLESIIGNVIDLVDMADVKAETTFLLPLPLSHIFGLTVLMASLTKGASMTFIPTIPSFFEILMQEHFDIVAAVPAMWSQFLTMDPKAFKFQPADILLSGGAALPPSLAEEFRKRFGRRLNNGYGSTECKIVALNLDGPDHSVGRIVDSDTVDVVDADDVVLTPGEVGEIRIHSPNLMQGYYLQPEETNKVLHDGHYHTGDLGYVKDGYLYISGRDKEMINVAGNKVFPTEVEDLIRRHPEVGEVAVIGVPHYKLGQIVKAIIVLKESEIDKQLQAGGDAGKEAKANILASLKNFCKENLKRELRPMEWDFRTSKEPLPKLNTGKVDRKQLASALVTH